MSVSKVSFAKALNTALADAMEASREVVVFGEDVGTLGGVFRITDGLTARFGRERCFDTPLAESGIIGTAVGMAMNGMRPVAEMQFDAFAYPAFEQVASHVAKMHNRTRGKLPMPLVIRIPYGGGVGGVEHHCDSSESYYAHTPGLKVFTPASVTDAYVMLREAIDSPDPVVFFEPKRLYWSTAQVDMDELRSQYENGTLPRREGHALVAREGSDATLISYGPSVPVCLAAAEEAARDGMSVEVAESQGFASVASEIAARTQERCFHSLAAPVLRVTGFDIPYPSPSFEHHHIPSSERILDALDDLQWED